MAKFYSGSWHGTHYKVVPLNKRIKINIPAWLSENRMPYILLDIISENQIQMIENY